MLRETRYQGRHRWAVAALLAGALLAPLAARATGDPGGAEVTKWSTLATNVVAVKNAPPANPNTGPQHAVTLAIVHAAIYDAVNAIDGRYSVFWAIPTTNPAGASEKAAAASAAYNTLVGLFPDQAAALNPEYLASLATVPDGDAKTRGIAVGREVATTIVALRSTDGRNDPSVGYTFQPAAPGVYQKTIGATLPGYPPFGPIMPWITKMRPLTMDSPQQFRADGPPALSSYTYGQDLNETKRMGGAVSADRTAEQTETAFFHTMNPTLFWGQNYVRYADDQQLGLADTARLMAMLYVALGDSIIGCFDSKYYFNFWRPFTAIRAADTDGNAATEVDQTWLPLASTPPHPEYPAAHGCSAGATAEIMRRFFRGRAPSFTMSSNVARLNPIDHFYERPNDLVKEIVDARIHGGMHLRVSGVDGAELGQRTAKWIAKHYFQKVRGRGGHAEEGDDRDD